MTDGDRQWFGPWTLIKPSMKHVLLTSGLAIGKVSMSPLL